MRSMATVLQGFVGCFLVIMGHAWAQAQVAFPPAAAVPGTAPAANTAIPPPQITIPVPSYAPSAPSLLPPPSLHTTGEVRPVSYDYDAQAESQVPPLPPADQLPSSRETPFQIAPQTPPAGDSQTTFAGNPPVQDLSSVLPGNFSNTRYKWYGFVRLDGIYDFDPIASTDDFVTSSIPVPQGEGDNAVLTPRYTRLGWDTETPWDYMDWSIKTRIEVDFFNGNTSGAFGSFPLRLRFAWVDFGPFLIGQAASLFMDYDVFPNVIDYEGPPGMVLMRQPIAAVRVWDSETCRFMVGVEQPYSDIQWFEGGDWIVNPGSGIISTPGVERNIQDTPDFTANLRRNWLYGHTQVAGIARNLGFQDAGGFQEDELGYGINLTGTWHPWAHLHGCPMCEAKSPLERSRFLGQYATGTGITRYIQDANGFGLDATVDPVNGFRTIDGSGWFVAYEHWWSLRWISNFTYGESDLDLTDTLPDNTYDSATYYTANLIWLPVERMGVGMEVLYGTRENKDGQRGEATRIQMAFQYKF